MITGKKFIFMLSISFLVAFFITGCSERRPPEKIVAVINNYRMTDQDFNYESKEVLDIGILIGDIPITKEDILDALITKELLLQEAQARDLDRDKNFMKTIELYWEQTLIKNLLKKKTEEIKKGVKVYEDEIKAYYNKMKTKIKAKVLICSDEEKAKELLEIKGDVASYVQTESEKFPLLYVIPSRVYSFGEDSSILEGSIFSIDKGKNREIVEINGKWVLIIIEERIPAHPGSLSSLRNEIIKAVKARKEIRCCLG